MFTSQEDKPKNIFSRPQVREDFLEELANESRLDLACNQVGASLLELADYQQDDSQFSQEIGLLMIDLARLEELSTEKKASQKLSSQDKRDLFLKFLEAGHNISTASDLAGVSEHSYYYWCRIDQAFKTKAQRVLKTGLGEIFRKEKKVQIVSLLSRGLSVTETCRLAGVSTASYYRWRQSDKEFANQVQVAQQEARQQKDLNEEVFNENRLF